MRVLNWQPFGLLTTVKPPAMLGRYDLQQTANNGIDGSITAVNSTLNLGTVSQASNYTIPVAKTMTGIANLNVVNGTFDNVNAAITISTAVTTSANGIFSLNNTLTGSGTFTNAGTFNANVNFNVTGFTTAATSSGTINVAAGMTLTVGSNFTNTGLINLVGAASSLSGNLIGGAGSSLVIGSTAADTFTTTGTITNIKTITVDNASVLTVAATKNITGVDTAFNVTGGDAIFNAPVSGAGSFTISSGRTLTLNSSAVVSGFSSIDNGGAIVVNGTANVLPAITNIGDAASSLTTGVASSNVFSTNNTIDNIKTITIGENHNSTFTVNNFVTNVNTAFTVKDGSTANINAIMSGSGTVTNNGTLNTTSTINMGSYTTEIASAGAKLRILSSNGAGYGGLVCSGTADFTHGKIQIVEDTFPLGIPYSWTVIQSSGAFTPPVALDDIDIPANSFLSRWTKTINSNSLIITHVRHELTTANKPLEAVLQQMYSNPANAAQTSLINILTSVSVGFNDAIQKLLPSTNSIAPSIAVNNQAINKIEMRVAAMRDGLKSPSAVGISAGELAPDTSVWISNFGSITNQQRNGDMDGYKAKSLGVLLGFDTKTYRKNFIGFALGSSGSNVRSHLNESSTTKIHRYHALAYGSRNLGDNNHLDWLVTGSYNKNNGSKPIIINGNDLSTIFNFASRQGSVKLVRGKSFDFWESYRFTPLTSIQYSYAHQDAYQERGSIAATRFSKMSKNVVTVGAGARFDFPVDSWSLIGMREFRAVVNYDVVNTKNRMIASFVAGSSNFMVTDDPARLAVKLGAGMTFELADKLQLQFNYDYEIRRSFTDHTGMLKLRYLF